MLRSRPVVALVTLVTLAQTLAGCSAGAPSPGGVAQEPSYPQQYTASDTAASPAEYEAAPATAGATAAPTPMAQQPMAPPPSVGAPPAPPPPPPPPMTAPMQPVKRAEAKVAVAPQKPSPQPAPIAVAPPEPKGTEDYKDHGVNPVVDPQKDRLSTFAIDVDTASYSIARRKIMEGTLPPFASVRAEEFLNLDFA